MQEKNSFSILVIDDESKNVQLLANLLKEQDYTVQFACSGDEAFEWLNARQFDLILLDILMPVINGFEVCKRLKASAKTKDIPIIFLTAKTETEDLVKGFELGAVDYITKPFNKIELMVRVKTHLQLKYTMEQYRIAKDRAEAANRAKTEFLANMSHDIRTPLNAITGFGELLTVVEADIKQKSYLEAIITAGKKLNTLISDILDLAKIEAGRLAIKYTPVNPIKIFKEIELIFKTKIKVKNLDFIINMDEDLPPSLLLDETKLRQVLLNLVGNAIKFTEKGYIKLSAAIRYKAENHKKVDLTIYIEDSGIGIPEQVRKTLFKGTATDNSQSFSQIAGTGLGLAISKRLIEMMNGAFYLHNKVEGGTSVEITLQDIETSSLELTAIEEISFDIKDISFEKGKILIADDIETNRILLAELMTLLNLDFVMAENGQEALLLAVEYQPDIILMDVQMPVMDGYKATRHLRKNPETQNITVIAISASTNPEDLAEVSETVFDGFLAKPVDIHKLISVLSKYLVFNQEKIVEKNVLQFNPDDLSTDTLSKLPRIIDTLESQFMSKWEEFQEMQPIKEVKQFALELETLGRGSQISILEEFGKNLSAYVNNFDVDNILLMLNEFPELIKRLKSIKN